MWDEKLKFYDQLVATCPRFERKGKSVPHTASNTFMFSLLNKEGEIGIRLSPQMGREFMEKYNTTIYKSHGAVMKDYVLVPENLYSEMEVLTAYLDKSFDYVNNLAPNPRKKK